MTGNKPGYELVYVRDGSLYGGCGNLIKEPSLVIDGDVLISANDYTVCLERYNHLSESLNLCGLSSSGLRLYKLDNGVDCDGLTVHDVAYIFRRAFNFTASGFLLDFQEKWGKSEFLVWLKSEEERVPLKTKTKNKKVGKMSCEDT